MPPQVANQMEKMDYTPMPDSYNTSINIIGGLRDAGIICKSIDVFFSPSDSLDKFICERNEFGLRTEKSRDRIEREITKGFLSFINEDHQELIRNTSRVPMPRNDRDLTLFWQFSLNNRLFREITSRVFMKIYYSGRISISKDDIIAYLKDFVWKNEPQQLAWSEKTISTLSSKYLNLMSKLGMVDSGKVKKFRHVSPSTEAQVLFLYFAKLFAPQSNNILTNILLPLSFVPTEDIQIRLKKLSLKGFINMSFDGVILNVELIHDYKKICDVLYH